MGAVRPEQQVTSADAPSTVAHMSENLRMFTKALYTLRAVADRVPADAWDNQSCCSDWTAREVAGHASWVIQAIGAGASGGERPAEQPEAEVAGADPAATIRRSVDGTLEALDHQGVLQKIGPTPFGEMPLDDFIGGVWVDPLTHAWDIADATGVDAGIDDETAARAAAVLEVVGPMIRSAGGFGPRIEGGETAIDRMLGEAGRASVRT